MPFLVMEHIVGQTIAQLIADRGHLDPATVAELGRQVALGLDHLHQKGLLHRDINPTNVLVDRSGSAKITDLGLAIDLGDAEDVVTRDGATVGTFDYISPEQARNPRQIDTRSDIYSLGCSLYHMLTGRVPFPAPSLPEKLFAHQSKEPDRIADQVAGVPEGLARVVLKMMSKKPEERYARPVLAARALEEFARPGKVALDEPSTEPRRTPASVVLGDAAVRGGSDPDLAIVPSSTSEPKSAAASSDPFEFVKIDFGAGAPLSETRTSARTQYRERLWPGAAAHWRWVAAAGLVCLALTVLFFATRGKLGDGSSPAAGEAIEEAGQVLASDIMVEYDDGEAWAAPTLVDAVRRAVGKPAKVVLRNRTPLTLGSLAGQQLRLTSGRLVIEAGPGARPVIEIALNAAAPAIVVAANSTLTLRGLTLRVERRLSDPNYAPAAIHATGNLRLDSCAIVLKGGASRARAVLAEGNRLDVVRCFVRGFESSIGFSALSAAGSEARVENSIIVGAAAPESASPPDAGWALQITVRPNMRSGVRPVARAVIVDHCTIVGTGFARFDGPIDKIALTVELRSTIVAAQALVMWPALPFPSALAWTGRQNCYEISGETLVVAVPGAPAGTAEASAPKDLAAWAATASVSEVGSQNRVVRFPASASGPEAVPTDFRLESELGYDAGAKPSEVAVPAD
jgi:hypothetical protein